MLNKPTVVVEEYLLLLYKLRDSHGHIKAVDLAQRLNIRPPTVHATLQRMQRDGMVQIGDKKTIRLTEEGENHASSIAFRHNLAEYFLCHTLGISWSEVHKHAHKLEHAMTPIVVEKLAAFLNYPEACPHGTPNPGYSLPDDCFTLDKAKEKMMLEIIMISEELEDSEELLKILQDQKLMPGQKHQLISRSPVMESITLQQQEQKSAHPFVLPLHVAEKIHVIQAKD